jgi:hypothetical protein
VRIRLSLLAALAAVAVSVPATVAAVPEQANPHATLVRVDVFDPAKGGKGGPPAPSTANCSDEPAGATSSSDWALTGWKTAGGAAHLNSSTVPAALGDVRGVLQASFDAWGSEPNVPDFTVVADGTVTRATANRGADLLFGRVSGNAIAVTYTWRWSDGLIESDTVFNRSLAWAILPEDSSGCAETQPFYDLGNIAVHEFGHIYGLDHPAAGRFESMYKYGYTGEVLKRTPGDGDRTGLGVLYAP